MQRILTVDQHLQAYKIQTGITSEATRSCAASGFRRLDIEAINKLLVIFRNHFLLEGYVNKKNCRIWKSHPYGVDFGLAQSPYFFNRPSSQHINQLFMASIGRNGWHLVSTITGTTWLFQTKYPGCVISRQGDVNWPPRSYDLTPLGFFLWGLLKGKVNANS